jgi:hypothetical protein
MPKHHPLCIHGIGMHSNDWVNDKDDGDKSFQTLLLELWKSYFSDKGNLSDLVQFHSIHYDDEINKIFANWEEQAKNLKSALASSPLLTGEVDWFTDAVDKATAAKTASQWQYTHLMDLLLFAGSPSIQDRLVSYIGRQIIDLIVASPEDYFSIIGHSMGTAAANKVIQALFTQKVKDSDGNDQTLRGDFKFQNVCMVANTSYSLSRDRANHYSTIVRPSMSVGNGCCNTWINVNHRLDPVGQFLRFDYRKNPAWLDPKIDARHLMRDISPNIISSKNIHSINHYFRDPILHFPYFELVLGAKATKKQQDAAIDAFNAATPQGAFKTLQAHLETIDLSNTSSMKAFFESLKTFYSLVESFV